MIAGLSLLSLSLRLSSFFFGRDARQETDDNTATHRRRIELEDKAKVVASVWGTEFVQFLAALAVLPWSI